MQGAPTQAETRPISAPWPIAADRVDVALATNLGHALGIPLPLATLLLGRGHDTPEKARAFLQPRVEHLHDPQGMLDLPLAVARLRSALLQREPILIYGDYDVDGTVATVLLKTALERAAISLGVVADVRYHIPHRIREGYGMREARIADAAAEGVRLVVSVDTGIRAFAAAAEAERHGLDLIVTDHHLPDSAGVPRAVAVLNPNQPGCSYPCKELCGAGVAFKLAQAVLESSARDPEDLARIRSKTLPSFLKLLAIATVADAVPLTGENRVVASLGLHALRSPAQSGLRTVMELAGIDLTRPISATDVGFRIGPRINAAGRMDVASDVVEMFLTRDPALARSLAEKLHLLNEDRRATEARALREIEAQLEVLAAQPGGLEGCLVLDDTPENPWHRGVVGILASRVVDRTARPALVLTHEGGEAHGSGRSVPGFHLLDALTSVHGEETTPLFSRFGGHAHAAGFALPSAHVPELRKRLQTLALPLAGQVTHAAVTCDACIRLQELDSDFFAVYERLEPFGQGNPEPVFFCSGLRLTAPVRVIADRHLGLRVEEPGTARPFRATAWTRRTNWVERAREESWGQGTSLDLAFRLHRNWHPDFGGWELEIVAARLGDPA